MAASSERTVVVKTLEEMKQYRAAAAQVAVEYVPTELQEGKRVGVVGRGH
jgi:putative methionine-R-sulfoxide reductase with GAF domain